jgi:hypothetical protein
LRGWLDPFESGATSVPGADPAWLPVVVVAEVSVLSSIKRSQTTSRFPVPAAHRTCAPSQPDLLQNSVMNLSTGFNATEEVPLRGITHGVADG